MRISDWSSDVCSSDLGEQRHRMGNPAHMGGRDFLEERRPRSGGGGKCEVRAGERKQRETGGRQERRDRGERSRDERSEEHTSELQSLMRISYAVFCLKKKTTTIHREN